MLYGEALDRMNELADAKAPGSWKPVRVYLPYCGCADWWGVLVVSFTHLFGLENTLVHRLMVAVLALIISSVLFTIGVLEYPFSGDVRVGPEPFELVLERFESSKLSEL